MGTYNSAVITNGGQSMIAQAVAGASLEFTTIKTSSYAYPAGTNLATLTTINGIKQSKDITSATVYNSRVIKISAAVDNTGISTAYAINTIGIYAKVGSGAESLFAVVTASAADTMPAYNSKPYSYIYEINLTMQNAANVTVTVNAAGLVNVSDLNAAKVEIRGEIADLRSAVRNISEPSKNIFDYKTDYLAPTQVINNNDGSFTASGDGLVQFCRLTLAAGTYTASISPYAGNDLGTMYIRLAGGSTNTPSVTFTLDSEQEVTLLVRVYGNNVRFYVQVEVGNTATAYEEYSEYYTANDKTARVKIDDLDATVGGMLFLGDATVDFLELVESDLFDKIPVDVAATAENYKLTPQGGTSPDNTCRIDKYQVSAGELLYLQLSKDTDAVYQFSSNIAAQKIYRVGDTVTVSVDETVVVPDTATYLFVSKLKTNSTNKVEYYAPTGVDKSELDREIEDIAVTKQQGILNRGKTLIVGEDGILTLAESTGELTPNQAVRYFPAKTLTLDANLINTNTEVVLGSNWSGDVQNGFAHASGAAGDIVFNVNTVSGKRYLVTFESSNYASIEGFLSVSIGDSVPVDPYNGTANMYLGFISDGGTLKISCIAGFAGTISNVALRELSNSGSETFVLSSAKEVNHGNMTSDITGFWNIGIGAESTLRSNQNGTRNIGIGVEALTRLVSGHRNVAVGTFAMAHVSSGDRNIGIGADCLTNFGSPNNNAASDNIAIGKAALRSGNIRRNVAVGNSAMGSSNDSAEGNVAIGFYAGRTNNGNNNVYIGNDAGVSGSGAVSNSVAIGKGVKVSGSNQIQIGDSNHTIYLAGKKITFESDGSVSWSNA